MRVADNEDSKAAGRHQWAHQETPGSVGAGRTWAAGGKQREALPDKMRRQRHRLARKPRSMSARAREDSDPEPTVSGLHEGASTTQQDTGNPFSKRCWENWASTGRKMTPGPYLMPHTKSTQSRSET